MLRRKHYSSKVQALKTSVPYGSTKVEYLEHPSSILQNVVAYFNIPINVKSPEEIRIIAEHLFPQKPVAIQLEGVGINYGTFNWGWSEKSKDFFFSFDGDSAHKNNDTNVYLGDMPINEWFVYEIYSNDNQIGFLLNETLLQYKDVIWLEQSMISLKNQIGVFGRIGLLAYDGYQYQSYGFYGRKRKHIIFEKGLKTHDLIPSIDKTGTPCMFDLVSRKNFYNAGTGQFTYPTISTTYSLRRPQAEWAKMTDTGVHKIYHTPIGYEGSIEDYAIENGYKRLIETESPSEEGKYYSFKWVETEDTLTTEWFEIDPPQEEFFEETLDNSQIS